MFNVYLTVGNKYFVPTVCTWEMISQLFIFNVFKNNIKQFCTVWLLNMISSVVAILGISMSYSSVVHIPLPFFLAI